MDFAQEVATDSFPLRNLLVVGKKPRQNLQPEARLFNGSEATQKEYL
jgi:hypothetical protein